MAVIADGVRRFFEGCPLLDGSCVAVNYLGAEPMHYAVLGEAAGSVVRAYVDGGALKQWLFVFASREFYDSDQRSALDTARFYEELCAWLEEENEKRHLPELSGGLRAVSIEALSHGYVFDARLGTAQFQIQCRLIYEKE